MARGSDETPRPAPRRHPLAREIGEEKMQEMGSTKKAEREAIVYPQETRQKHAKEDIEMLIIHLNGEIARSATTFQQENRIDARTFLDDAKREEISQLLGQEHLLTPSVREELQLPFIVPQKRSYSETESLCFHLSSLVAQDILAFSEANDMAYGEAMKALREVSGNKHSESLEYVSKMIKRYLPIYSQ